MKMSVESLTPYIGKDIIVVVCEQNAKLGDTMMSIRGELQQHPNVKEHFRVLTLDNGTFTYFRADELDYTVTMLNGTVKFHLASYFSMLEVFNLITVLDKSMNLNNELIKQFFKTCSNKETPNVSGQ